MASLVYYIATTADGFIARPDGDTSEFPMDPAFLAHIMDTYPETLPAPFRTGPLTPAGNRRFGSVLMGRHTYAVGLGAGLASPYPTLRQFVFASKRLEGAADDVTVVSEQAVDHVRRLKADETRDIWLCGGSQLAATLFEAGLVDEIILKINPLLFGSGMPLLARSIPPLSLETRKSTRFPSGHVWIEYAVSRR